MPEIVFFLEKEEEKKKKKKTSINVVPPSSIFESEFGDRPACASSHDFNAWHGNRFCTSEQISKWERERERKRGKKKRKERTVCYLTSRHGPIGRTNFLFPANCRLIISRSNSRRVWVIGELSIETSMT